MPGEPLRTFIRHLCQLRDRAAADGLSDAELLERFARKRDEAAFEVLVWRHGAMVLGVCRRLLHSSADAEDAFQATFLTLVRKAASIRRREALAAWLYRVAFRIALQARSEVQRRTSREEARVKQTSAAIPNATDPEALALLEEEVARLPAKYRLPVLLCYYQGQTTAEAAHRLGCPRGTVLSRLAWARQRLRGRLTRRGVALAAGLGALRLQQRALAAVPAQLVQAAVRVSLPGAEVSAPVTALTEGALRAMFVSKLKIALVVTMAVGLLGLGAGGWVYRPSLAAQAPRQEAEKSEKAKSSPSRPQQADQEKAPQPIDVKRLLQEEEAQRRAAAREEEAQRRAAARLDQLRREQAKAEAELEDTDKLNDERLVEERIRLLVLEDGMRQMEREHARHRERELANLKALEFDVSKARESLRADLAKIADKEQAEKIAKKQAEAIEERNVRWMAEEAEFRAAEAKRSKEMLDLRKEMLREEAKLQRLERQNAASHRRAAEKVEAVNEAIRQVQGGAPRAESPDRLLMELVRKVEALQRDVAELRRELRRPQNERDK